MKQFADVKAQIDKINNEISGYGLLLSSVNSMNLEEQDLSLRKLNEYQTRLRALQKEKVCLKDSAMKCDKVSVFMWRNLDIMFFVYFVVRTAQQDFSVCK